MGLSRRDALLLGAAGVVSGCARGGVDTGDSVELEEWPGFRPEALVAVETLDEEAFGLGVAAGDAEPDAATLWTRYSGDGALELVVFQHVGGGWVEVLAQAVTPDEHGMVHERFSHEPDASWFTYYFRHDGGRSDVGTWRAPPSGGDYLVTFGGTSCTYLSGDPFPVLSRGAEGGVGLWLYGGDNVYADSATSADDYRRLYAEYLATPGFRAIRAACSGVACWDDHEVENQWGTEPASDEETVNGIAAFYEHHPTRERDPALHYRSQRIGDTVEIFVLDCRSERVPELGTYVSAAQLQWLIDSVLASTAAFKVVLNSVPIADLRPLFASVSEDDRWSGYPDQRQEALDALDGVPGVFFVSGDIHMGLVARVEDEGAGSGLWDIVIGPGGSTPNGIGDLVIPDDRYRFGSSTHTWSRFTANPLSGRLRVEFLDGDGTVLYDEDLESNP